MTKDARLHIRRGAAWQNRCEMEALTAVQISLLTIYDMCKAVDKGMVMDGVRVLEKHGGRSGNSQ